MNSEDADIWRLILELKLRRTNGNAFQSFFAEIMEARHGSDYVRLRPHGRLGDSGCDGYIQSTGDVFQCYGAVNGSTGNVANLVKKMREDFAKALDKVGHLMKSWHMTHNIIEGLPIQAVEVIDALRIANPGIEFGFVGLPRLTEIVGDLDEAQRRALLGPAARNVDYQKLQLGEVRDLVDNLMAAIGDRPIPSGDIEPVSAEKLAYNNLPGEWAHVIQLARVNAHHISTYFQRHHDPMRGEQVAQIFRERYSDLKAQGLKPASLMAELFEFVAGPEARSVGRQVAAHSILAYLFESCDILENPPDAAVPP